MAQIPVTRIELEAPLADPLEAGREALARGEWERALACFEAAAELGGTAEAVEALGMAAWWLDDADATIEARERAYRLYREQGDPRGAARAAIWLAWDYNAFRGEPAVANGWLQRATHLLSDVPTCPEHGWLALRQGEIALVLENDARAAEQAAARARTVGATLGLVDLEMSGFALEGLALVSAGEVAEGMSRLDETSVAAVAGEFSELWAAGRACCYLITACEVVKDYDRAAQWCERMQEFAKRWRIPTLFAVCRTHYASVLIWRGAWSEAEAELAAASRELAATRPGMGAEAVVRLGELRRCQGRLEEAAVLFRRVEFHPSAQLGLAAVALDEGDATAAIDLAGRFLRSIGPENRLDRAAALQLLVRARVACGDVDRARQVLADLQRVATDVGTEPLRGAAALAEGLVAAAEADFEAARIRLEDAVDLFQRTGAPLETARARIELAHALRALGRPQAAEQQVRAALDALAAMGAAREAERAEALLRELASPKRLTAAIELTRRELEVLRLVSEGLSNPEIAARLVLSEHTVHRHIANILRKLGLPSRAAAAVYGARRGLL